jgi:enamine deaminase RidA (YjgF/YER057c/UK114 family)
MSLQKIVSENLKVMGLILPEPPKPGGNYVSVNVVKSIAYVAIQIPKVGSQFLYQGRLGKEFTTEDGYKAAELCAINVLAAINKYVGFEKIYKLNHFDAYFQATEDWDDSPTVINGASDLFIKILGDAGSHSRAIFGVHSMPKNFAVGITATFTLL